jgi:radical SAM protein with 4Fe4S-binding SPASM domain
MINKDTLRNLYSEIVFILKNKFSKPREVVIEITDRCNLDCSFCFNKILKKDDSRKVLNFDCIKDIINNVCEFGIPRIRFTGGEPLLREDVFDLMSYAKCRGLKVWLNTNATLIDEKTVTKLSRLVDSILVPFSSFDEKTESMVTKKISFESKILGIQLLRKKNITVRIGTVATKFNIQNLEKIHNFVEKLRVNDWLLFRPIPNWGSLFPIDNEDIEILVEKLLKINNETGGNYRIFNAMPFCSYEPSRVSKVAVGGRYDDGHTKMIIDSKGIVRAMYYMDKEIGDILISKDIKNFWNNQFMKDIRNLKLIAKICKKCKYLYICLGGSRSISRIINKSFDQLDYLAQPLKYKRQLFQNA